MQELNKIDAYKPTKTDPIELVEFYKKRFQVLPLDSLTFAIWFH